MIRPFNRFQIIAGEFGAVGFARSRQAAFDFAKQLNASQICVEDRMTRHGCVNRWRLTDDGWEPVSRKAELPDSESFDAVDFEIGSSLRSVNRDWIRLSDSRRRE